MYLNDLQRGLQVEAETDNLKLTLNDSVFACVETFSGLVVFRKYEVVFGVALPKLRLRRVFMRTSILRIFGICHAILFIEV